MIMFALYENGKQPRSGIGSLFITYCVVCDRLLLMILCLSGMNVERATYILGALLNLFLFFVLKHVKVNKSKFTQAELTMHQSLMHAEGVNVTIGRGLLT
jgi:hypothetical protein